ncbi:MAG: hypothetical protein JKY46_10630 [Robiginitomaculum sp.]|nr:hypothetical protein [Robiginitomaculum sp.]
MSKPSFSISGYCSIIETSLAAGYRVTPFSSALSTPEPAIILRHDIDLSLPCAIEVARAEAEMGVSATYFIMMSSDYYNPFSAIGRHQVQQIAALGHEIGLHWDSSNYPESDDAVHRQFRNELAHLGDIVGEEIVSASQHIPTDTPLFDVESLVENEAYSQKFRNRFTYVSDSSMQWRETTPLDLIKLGKSIHFLSHPIWWAGDGDDQAEKLRRMFIARCDEMETTLTEFTEYLYDVLSKRDQFDANFIKKKGKMNK